MGLSPGARLGPYEIVAPLGAGGMGAVYRAIDPRLGRAVALKVLHDSVARDPERLRRFETEARAAGALNHPSVVAVFDVGTADGVPYVVSELLEGETLRERLGAGPLRLGKALEFGVQIGEGLAAAHDEGVVHRDLKPENLFVTRGGRVKILDFGLAKLRQPAVAPLPDSGVETCSNITEAGVILGTVGYMSPEQIRGLPADHRSDIFSFGAVLFEMLTGRRAFQAATAPETLTAILRADPVEAAGTGSGLRPGVRRLLARCLEKKADDRFQSARDIAFSLESLVADADVGAEPVTRPRPPRWPLVAAFGLVVALGGFVAGRSSRPEARLPRYRQLTFDQGVVMSARFGPDRETVYYSAEWPGRPMEIFSTWGSSTASRAVGLSDAKLLSVSQKGEMAVLLRPRLTSVWTHLGTLASVALSGGTPRELLEDVQDADYSPDGKGLAVVRWVEDRCRLEFPIGRVLYEPPPPAWIREPRFSGGGDRIAIAQHPTSGDLRGSVAVVDLRGKVKTISPEMTSLIGLDWTEGDREVIYSGRGPTLEFEISAARPGGDQRLVARPAAWIALLDLAEKGRALGRSFVFSSVIRGRGAGDRYERDLSEQRTSYIADISRDGTVIVGTSQDEGAGPLGAGVFLRRTDGTSSVRLGDGDALALSRDGKWVLARLPRQPAEALVVLPTGAGQARELPAGEVQHYFEGKWLPDGNAIVFSGAATGSPPRLYVQQLASGVPRPLSPEGYTLPRLGASVSPDGRRVIAFAPDMTPVFYPTSKGDPVPIPYLLPGDMPIAWTVDGGGLFYYEPELDAARVHRLDLASGRAHLVKELLPVRPAGMLGQYMIVVSADGGSYAYSHSRVQGDLILVEGLE